MAVHVSQRWDVKWVAGKVLIALLLLVTVSANNTPSQSKDTIGVDTNSHGKGLYFYQHTWPVRVITSQILWIMMAGFIKRKLCFHMLLCQFQITTIGINFVLMFSFFLFIFFSCRV